MKTLILAAIRCSLMLTAVAALSIVYPTSVQAVPTTYHYTGNPFTDVTGPYTTSDFVTAMVTLAGPLGANMPLTDVTSQVTAFSLFDGVQTLSSTTPDLHIHVALFATNFLGEITFWEVGVIVPFSSLEIFTINRNDIPHQLDIGRLSGTIAGSVEGTPGVWIQGIATPDAGSTLSLMTLTLMALGLVARRFQRAAG
jgi:hypothetical protein